MLTIGSLFSGIGGLDLGLEAAGLGPVVWQCEVDPWCRRVLAHHWPEATRYDDVQTLTDPPPVDLIAGGFPCQDLSYAGKGAGLDGERSGLWLEFARIIRLARPRWVVVENVSALLARGLGIVLSDLAEIGYDAVWDCIPAQAVGAPHRRDRLFVVARRVPNPERDPIRDESERGPGEAPAADDGRPESRHLGEVVADTDRGRPQGERRGGVLNREREAQRDDVGAGPGGRTEPDRYAAWPPAPNDLQSWQRVQALSQPSICRLADGVSAGLVRDRRRTLKAYGNAVVPQVAEVIGRAIAAIEARPPV